MKKIYIVQSSQGSYEDYFVKNEKAFISRDKAKEFAKCLDETRLLEPVFDNDLWNDGWNYVYELEDKYPGKFSNTIVYNPADTSEYDKREAEIINLEYKEFLSYVSNKSQKKYTLDDVEKHQQYVDCQYSQYYPCTIKELDLDDSE